MPTSPNSVGKWWTLYGVYKVSKSQGTTSLIQTWTTWHISAPVGKMLMYRCMHKQYDRTIRIFNNLRNFKLSIHLDTGGTMAWCSNPVCRAIWHHLACVQRQEESLPPAGEDWYCSAACKQNPGKSYFCLCRRNRPGEPQVQCATETNAVSGVL